MVLRMFSVLPGFISRFCAVRKSESDFFSLFSAFSRLPPLFWTGGFLRKFPAGMDSSRTVASRPRELQKRGIAHLPRVKRLADVFHAGEVPEQETAVRRPDPFLKRVVAPDAGAVDADQKRAFRI